jgi:hypothetical protein
MRQQWRRWRWLCISNLFNIYILCDGIYFIWFNKLDIYIFQMSEKDLNITI